MPKDHARKNQLAELKDELGVKHADALALLAHPDVDERYTLHEYLATYADITTYKDAVAYLAQERSDPANQILCEKCGWTVGMACPECPGCGCYNGQCWGWRHLESMDEDEKRDYYACDECGGDTRNHYDCTCGEE